MGRRRRQDRSRRPGAVTRPAMIGKGSSDCHCLLREPLVWTHHTRTRTMAGLACCSRSSARRMRRRRRRFAGTCGSSWATPAWWSATGCSGGSSSGCSSCPAGLAARPRSISGSGRPTARPCSSSRDRRRARSKPSSIAASRDDSRSRWACATAVRRSRRPSRSCVSGERTGCCCSRCTRSTQAQRRHRPTTKCSGSCRCCGSCRHSGSSRPTTTIRRMSRRSPSRFVRR